MRVFVFEFITGGGLLDSPSPPSGCLLCEGDAMLRALATDLLMVPCTTVHVLRDHRLPPLALRDCAVHLVDSAEQERRAFERLAVATDYTILIAPEFDDHLLKRSRVAEQLGAKLLSPSSEFIRICSDKSRLCNLLEESGVPTPKGSVVTSGGPLPADFPYPAVLKPNDGAGSRHIRLVSREEARRLDVPQSGRWRLEQFRRGLSTSVAMLSGPRTRLLLPAGLQLLSADRRFQYLGGRIPLAESLQRRVRRLVGKAMGIVPCARGYIGMDLVLGDSDDGTDDALIEINPRLTTSYLGLRQLAKSNLAAAMVNVAIGHSCDLSFGAQTVEFRPDMPLGE